MKIQRVPAFSAARCGYPPSCPLGVIANIAFRSHSRAQPAFSGKRVFHVPWSWRSTRLSGCIFGFDSFASPLPRNSSSFGTSKVCLFASSTNNIYEFNFNGEDVEYSVNEEQFRKLKLFASMIIEENQKINLISRAKSDNTEQFFRHVMSRHVLDSLSLLTYIDHAASNLAIDYNEEVSHLNTNRQKDIKVNYRQTLKEQQKNIKIRIIDVGTGGGLPGISLAIMRPEYSFVLCDATAKKVDFLKRVIEELGIPNARAICRRLEELGHEVNKFNIILFRKNSFLLTYRFFSHFFKLLFAFILHNPSFANLIFYAGTERPPW